jgi:predicted aconitase with swiveling domain
MGGKLRLPSPPSGKTVRAGLLALGGVMGVTAGSAGISSLRRRAEAPKGGS